MDTILTPRLKARHISLNFYTISITICLLIASNLSISANTSIGLQTGITPQLNQIIDNEDQITDLESDLKSDNIKVATVPEPQIVDNLNDLIVQVLISCTDYHCLFIDA